MADNVVRLPERPSDALLVAQACAGDLDAKRKLFERYVGLASAIAFRLTGSDSDMEDVVQDSFIAAFEALPRLLEPQAFRGWFSAIVTRTAIATLRKRRLLRRLGLLRREPVRIEVLVSAHAPPDLAAELKAVYQVLDALPPEERVTLLLRRFEQLSLEEVAEQTGASLATVKRRLVRADERLRKALKDASSQP